jgi:glycosyltransferase involved in cell wall biosynthesis
VSEISVVVPSFNHGKYVCEAIDSVLNQSCRVSEIIVVDDASSDDSVERIQRINDERITLITLNENLGGAEALNIGIARTTGSLVAICNSDDVWEPNKLELQSEILRQYPEVGFVFTDVTWVGKAGGRIKPPFGNVFAQSNKTRFQWMRQLFEQGNCLCHPSILARREMYGATPNYDNRLRQLPDYKMWLQMLQRASLYVMEEKLLRFRIHDNTSRPSPASSARDRNEFTDIARDFIENLNAENFVGAFGSHLPPYDSKFDLTVEKIIYLWSVQGHIKPIAAWIANNIAMNLLSTEAGLAAWRGYGLNYQDLHVLRGVHSPWTDLTTRRTSEPREIDVLTKLNAQHWIVPSRLELQGSAASDATTGGVPNSGAQSSGLGAARSVGSELLWRSFGCLRLQALWRHPLNRMKRKKYRRNRT